MASDVVVVQRCHGGAVVVMEIDGWRWNGGWVDFGFVGEKRDGGRAVWRRGENGEKGKVT
jgi:hypothetical protein